MATRKVKDAKDLTTNELIYFKGHAKATYMSDGRTVEDAINDMPSGGSDIVVDSELSTVSTNPVQNRAITIPLNTLTERIDDLASEKQDVITDLDTIRAGAAKGATALQSVPSEYVTESELTAKGYATTTQLAGKQDTINDLATIRSGAALGATALQTETYKGTVTGVKINGTTKNPTSGVVDLGTVITSHQDISGKQDKLMSGTNIKTINNTSILGSGNISITGGSGTITGVSANGTSIATSGVANIPAATTSKYGVTQLSSSTSSTSTSLAATPSAVKAAYDLANGKQDKLVSGTNIKTINGTSILGSGNITISGGSSSGGSGAYAQVNHGTSDTTFTLTPNTFHVWDEVASLTLTLGSEQSGVANEYVFQFTSGATATSLTLPDDIKWANDSAPTIAENEIYQISVLNGLATALEFNGGSALGGPILFYVNDIEYAALEGMTWERFINSDYADKSLFELRDGMAHYCVYPPEDDWVYIYYYGDDGVGVAYASDIIIPNRHYTAD